MGTETHAFMSVMVETHVLVFVMAFAGSHVISTTQMVTVVLTNMKISFLVQYYT